MFELRMNLIQGSARSRISSSRELELFECYPDAVALSLLLLQSACHFSLQVRCNVELTQQLDERASIGGVRPSLCHW